MSVEGDNFVENAARAVEMSVTNNHFSGSSISPRLNKEAANPYKMIFFTSAELKFSKFWAKVALNQ